MESLKGGNRRASPPGVDESPFTVSPFPFSRDACNAEPPFNDVSQLLIFGDVQALDVQQNPRFQRLSKAVVGRQRGFYLQRLNAIRRWLA